jgi:endoglucanase Acf2
MRPIKAHETTGLIKYTTENIQLQITYNFDVTSELGLRVHENRCKRKILGGFIMVLFLSVALTMLMILIASADNSKKSSQLMGFIQSRITIKSVFHSDLPTPLWGSVKLPFPTGAFWTNLVVKSGDGAIGLLPYGVKCLDGGIQISYGATRRIVTQLAVSDPFVTDIQISATQVYLSRSVDSFDNLAVTMAYRTTGNGKYRTHLVKGSPFITVVYEGATPVLSANLMQILNVEAKVVKGSVGIQYIVTLGNSQKWLVYCSEPVAFTWKDNTLTAPSAIRGMVRVAVLPSQNVDAAFNLLLTYV